jgi:rubrerythrin
MDAPLEGAFLPCGHMAACMACGQRVMDDRGACPICDTAAAHFSRIFCCSA